MNTCNRAEPRSNRSQIARLSHVVVASVLLSIGGATAAHVAFAQPAPGFVSDHRGIGFVDPSGNLSGVPRISITGAYPGMSPRGYPVELRNVGTLDEIYTVSATVDGGAARSLDDVLWLKVRDVGTGEVVYAGRLSGLSFGGPGALAPNRSDAYVFQISWPETGGSDNAYQGLRIGFDLTASASPATV